MVEAIVADLDALDGDPDLEPSLGAANPHHNGRQEDEWGQRLPVRKIAGRVVDIDDAEHNGREPDDDAEPDDRPDFCVSYAGGDHDQRAPLLQRCGSTYLEAR